jgi:hypothetical protein
MISFRLVRLDGITKRLNPKEKDNRNHSVSLIIT